MARYTAACAAEWLTISTNPIQPDDYPEDISQAALMRDIIGNPFLPVSLDPSWLTPAVVTLAQAIYDECAFHRMVKLGDVLEAAGCANTEILRHCRGRGLHVRGCCVVDSLIGKR